MAARARGGARRARRAALDSSVLVASFLPAHEHHRKALAAIEALVEGDGGFLVVVHAVLETYSVLTRLPPPHRLTEAEAFELLHLTCQEHAVVVPALDPGEVWAFLARHAHGQVGGGRIYDAAILAGSIAAGARSLVTLNPRHFSALVPAGFDLVGIP